MAIVVGSPTPADQIGPLEALIAANQLQSQTSGECAHLLKSPGLNYSPMIVAVTVVLFYDFCKEKYLCSLLEVDYWQFNALVLTLDQEARTVSALLSSCLSDPLHFPFSDWTYLGISFVMVDFA